MVTNSLKQQLFEFKEFKKRILIESAFDSTNTLYGLSKDHIKFVLGISVPTLLESVDRKTRKKILLEQFFYEQFFRNLYQGIKQKAQAAYQGVKQAAQKVAATPFAAGIKGEIKRVLNTPKTLGDLMNFLHIVGQSPKYIKVFGDRLFAMVENAREKFQPYLDQIKESLESVEEKDKVKKKAASGLLAGINKIESVYESFKSLEGWKKAIIGVFLAVIGTYLYTKLPNFVKTAVKSVPAAVRGADKGTDVDLSAKGALAGAAGAVAAKNIGAAVRDKIIGLNFEESGDFDNPGIFVYLSQAFTSFIGGLQRVLILLNVNYLGSELAYKMTSQMHFALSAMRLLVKAVGSMGIVANVLAPATTEVVRMYNEDQKAHFSKMFPNRPIPTSPNGEEPEVQADWKSIFPAETTGVRVASGPEATNQPQEQEVNNQQMAQTRVVRESNQIKLAEFLFEEQTVSSKKRTEKFINNVYDDVYPALYRQAKFVIDTMKSGKKPSNKDVVNHINHYMNRYQDINPIVSMDTYGVNMMISYLLKNSKDAGKAKRFYKSMIDAWLKNKI